MTKKGIVIHKKLLTELQQYISYDKSINSIREEREKRLFNIRDILKEYVIEENLLDGMVFAVNNTRELTLRGELVLDEQLGKKIVRYLPYYIKINLMSFEREDGKAIHVKLEFKKHATIISLPFGMTKDEVKELTDKHGFTITVDYLYDIIRRYLRDIEKIDKIIKILAW